MIIDLSTYFTSHVFARHNRSRSCNVGVLRSEKYWRELSKGYQILYCLWPCSLRQACE